MRFDYDGVRNEKHVFYLSLSRPMLRKGRSIISERSELADETEDWCEQHIRGRYQRVTNYQFEVNDDAAAMEFRLRWC